MLTIPGTRPNTLVEFCRGSDRTIQIREIPAQPADSLRPWRNLSRLETIFYLNCGGVVGLWLEDLRRQGFLQMRQKRRTLAATFLGCASTRSSLLGCAALLTFDRKLPLLTKENHVRLGNCPALPGPGTLAISLL